VVAPQTTAHAAEAAELVTYKLRCHDPQSIAHTAHSANNHPTVPQTPTDHHQTKCDVPACSEA
jgi:hypothetical protein